MLLKIALRVSTCFVETLFRRLWYYNGIRNFRLSSSVKWSLYYDVAVVVPAEQKMGGGAANLKLDVFL
jgi:hypothetical protein